MKIEDYEFTMNGVRERSEHYKVGERKAVGSNPVLTVLTIHGSMLLLCRVDGNSIPLLVLCRW